MEEQIVYICRGKCQWTFYWILLCSLSISHCSVEKANVVVIVADDLGMGDVGCFGNDTIRTPNIDRIAKEGVLFRHHLAAASVCTPSRAALLTGRYPIRSGMTPIHIVRVNMFVSSTGGLPANETTIAEVAKSQGYSTAAVGKWHLGLHCESSEDFCHHPLRQGFDYFYGLPLTNLKDFGDDGSFVTLSYLPYMDLILTGTALAGVLTVFLLRKQGAGGKRLQLTFLIFSIVLPLFTFWFYRNIKLMNSIIMRNFEVVEQPITFSNLTQRLVKESIHFIEEQSRNASPFLLYIPWVQVHTVLHTAKEFAGKSKHGKYGDNVQEMDWAVGQVIDSIEMLGLKKNTFVYFTSDNGGHGEETDSSGEVAGGWNGIYKGGKTMGGMDGGIRVPTVAMFPGHIPHGSVIEHPTSLMDIFPTVSALLGVDLPKDRVIDGKNIWPLMTQQSNTRPHEFLFHYCGIEIHAARYSPEHDHSIWKLHFATPNWLPETEHCGFVCGCYGNKRIIHNPPLLYNIAEDPSERNPLDPRLPEHKKVIEVTTKAAEEHITSVKYVESQYAIPKMIPRPWLQPCCNFPYCNCIDNVYINGTI